MTLDHKHDLRANASAFVARENRFSPRIKCGAGFFRIMLQWSAR
jgi:hypothetical protein